MYDLRDGKYNFEKTDVGYTVTPEKKLDGINVLFFLNSHNFAVDKQRVEQPADNVSLDVVYGNYEVVGNKPFPTQIDILSSDESSETRVGITFKNIDLDTEIRFPFSIPSSYTEIKLDEK